MGDQRPEVFVSATSADLRSSRQSVKEALLTLGCVPVEQTNFPPDYRTVREMLREKILACDAVIHVAGECYGAEPREHAPGSPRRSYTQLEYHLARELGRPLYVFICGADFAYDEHEPEDSEKQGLQQQHRVALSSSDRLYVAVRSHDELAQRVRELRPLVDALTREIARRNARLKWMVVIGLLALTVVVAGTLMIQDYQGQKLRAQAEARAKALPDEVTAAVLAELGRQGLSAPPRDAAALPLDFPAAFREVAERFHITTDQAEAFVLKWVAEKQGSSDLTERSKAEFLAKNFTKSAGLSGEAAAAKLRRAERLATERARLVAGAVEDFQRAGEALRAGGQLLDAIVQFEQALGHVSRAESPQTWGTLQNWLGICHGEIGIRVEGTATWTHLRSSVAAYREALKVRTREQLPRDWAMTQNNLGAALRDQAERSAGAETVRLLAESVAAYREALTVNTREQLPQDWATTRNNLGVALRDQAGRSEGPEAVRLLSESVAAYRESLKVRTREHLPQDWAITQNNLGNALSDQAGRSEGAEAVRLLGESVAAYRESLTVRTREQLPQDWAATQNNLGRALWYQAARSETKAVPLLVESVAAYHEALKVYTREQLPQGWAMTQNNLGAALYDQARRSEGAEAVRLLGDSVAACREALKVYTREQLPQDWAMTQNNLGAALSDLAERSGETEAVRLLGDSVAAFREALKVYTREAFPYLHGGTSRNLARAEEELRRRH